MNEQYKEELIKLYEMIIDSYLESIDEYDEPEIFLTLHEASTKLLVIDPTNEKGNQGLALHEKNIKEKLLREENEIKYKEKRKNERKEFIKLVEEYKSKFPKAAEELGYVILEIIIDFWLNELRLYTCRDRLHRPCDINDIANNVYDYLEANYLIIPCHSEFHTPYLSMMCGSGSINYGFGRNI